MIDRCAAGENNKDSPQRRRETQKLESSNREKTSGFWFFSVPLGLCVSKSRNFGLSEKHDQLRTGV